MFVWDSLVFFLKEKEKIIITNITITEKIRFFLDSKPKIVECWLVDQDKTDDMLALRQM